MVGKIYVAKQNDNPFNNFLSLYLVIQDPERGLLVKLPGKADLDPVTGQITTTFDDLPQFPVSDMELSAEGRRAGGPGQPATCGTKTINADFYSWHDPEHADHQSSSYDITQKADGSPCVNNLGERPFKPDLTAGTVNPSAGSYSPLRLPDHPHRRRPGVQPAERRPAQGPAGQHLRHRQVLRRRDRARPKHRAAAAPKSATTPAAPASSQIGSTDVG